MADIDPALRGTRFGKALEDAERDIQLKRQQRDRESNPDYVREQARALASALRGTPRPTSTPSIPTQPFQKAKEMNAIRALSETQIKILALGYEAKSFKTGVVGRAIGKMADDGLIIPAETKGEWSLTEHGRNTYEMYLAQQAATNDQVYAKEEPINTDDPALKPSFEVLNFAATQDDVQRVKNENETLQKRIMTLNKSLDDMGALADRQTTEIKALEARIEQLTGLSGDGRNNIGEALEFYMALVAPVLALMEQDGYATQRLGEYVTQLHTANKTWREALIDPLIDLIVADGSAVGAGEDVRNDPVFLMRYISLMSHNLHSMTNIADERAEVIQQRDTQIEALRRRIDEMNADLRAATYNREAAEMNAFLACVLDELASQITHVTDYRDGRVQAYLALRKLQDRKP